MNKELEYYNKIKSWNFDDIHYEEDNLTNWDMYKILKNNANKDSKILDLGTGGGEKVLEKFPDVKEIIATDFSEKMIKTAKENLEKFNRKNRKNIQFKIMDNLKMNTPNNYFDIVIARHTCISAKQIYQTLKYNGKLILRGVDKLDCWQLKRLFNKGQSFLDTKPISQIDYENILDAGFKNVELVPIYIREYYKTKEDLLALLLKTPILNDFSFIGNKDKTDLKKLETYIENNSYNRGILLRRRYYGIVAEKC